MPGFVAEHLWKPENRKFHVFLKVAEAYGLPPGLFIDRDRTSTKWTPNDKKLALAWQTYKDELCPRCGTPIWLGHTTDNRVDFETDTTVCYACQALDNANKNDKTGLAAGTTRFVKPVAIEGEQLPTREEGYKNIE